MKKLSLVMVAVAAALLAGSAAYATSIADPWYDATTNPYSSADEWNLYQVYNAMYGTSYTSSADLPQVSNDVLFTAATTNPNVLFVLAQAAFVQSFGWYQDGVMDPLNPTVPAQNNVFTLTPPGVSGTLYSLPAITGEFGFLNDNTLSGGNLYFSDQSYNADLLDHMVMFYTPIADTYMIAFEDIADGSPQSDFDYNDLILEIQGVKLVPEPASMVLMGLGIAVLAVRRIRKS